MEKIRFSRIGWDGAEVRAQFGGYPLLKTDLDYRTKNEPYASDKKRTDFFEILIDYEGQGVVGIELVKDQGETWIYLSPLEIRMDQRGRGIGSEVVRSLYQLVEHPEDISGVYLVCKESLIPFYTRLGFSIRFIFDDEEIEKYEMALPWRHRKVYISGPITWKHNNNEEAFLKAERIILGRGDAPINPLMINHPSNNWTVCMRGCIKALVDCDSIYLLPGHDDSRGVQLELHIARELGLPVEEAT